MEATIKRFLRVALDAAIVAGVSALLSEIAKIQVPFFIQPVMTALLAAVGKYIRDKWGIRVPI